MVSFMTDHKMDRAVKWKGLKSQGTLYVDYIIYMYRHAD